MLLLEKMAKQGPFLVTCYLEFKYTGLVKNGFSKAGITYTVLHLQHYCLLVNH